MDPISAFSLAAAVINVVDFGTRILSDAYEIYQSGSGHKARDVELSTLSQDLWGLSKQLENRLQNVGSTRGGSEETLLDLCRRCSDASAELQNAVKSLQAKGTTKISTAKSSFVSALKSIWTENKIENLRGRLTEIRSQMTIAALVSVWEETTQEGQRHIDLRNRLDEITQKLDHRDEPARQFAKELIQMTFQGASDKLPRSNRDLVEVIWDLDWTSWGPGLRGQLFNVPQSADYPLDCTVPVAAKILSSLSFNDMYLREEGILDAYSHTFEWIFQDQQADETGEELQWPSFPAWLRETTKSIYWITGKPGSGKTTLMKFVLEHPLLREHLQAYAKDYPLLLAGFYFWNPGSGMQKSQQGLVRTLIHRCLSVREDLIPLVAPRRWAFYHILGSDSIAPEWDWWELKESFEILCSYNGKKFRLALFVDGLDEFEGDYKVLINWVKDTIARHCVKFCVSSRPWNVFSDAFGQEPSLTMQNLTRHDIDQFVGTEFEKSLAFRDLKDIFPDESSQLLSEIREKAQGVFLWVNLVVRSLLETLIDNPSLPQLQATLAEIPSDITGLYNAIWKSIPRERLPTSSKIFQLCLIRSLGSGSIKAETLWLANEGSLARKRVWGMDENARLSIVNLTKRLLDGHTRGILEISKPGNHVEFFHRTARDWLTTDKVWEEVCSKVPKDFEPNIEMLETLLIQQPLKEVDHTSLYRGATLFNFVLDCFLCAYGASKSMKVGENRVIQALDAVHMLAHDFAASFVERVSANSVYRPDEYASGKSGDWTTLQCFGQEDLENCFVGLAAQAGLGAYVKAKVLANKTLLVPKARRVSLLENAIFPGLSTVPNPGYGNYSIHPVLPGEERLELIRFLLEISNTRYETCFGESLYDAACREQSKMSESMEGPLQSGWYSGLLPLLEEHGYGPGQSRSQGSEKRQKLSKLVKMFFAKFRS